MWQGEPPTNFLRVVARSIQNAVTEHEERMHSGLAATGLPQLTQAKPVLVPSKPGDSSLRGRPRARGAELPALAEVDIARVDALAEWTVREGNCVRPPVPVNVVALLDPSRQVEIRDVDMEPYLPGGHRCLRDRWVILVNRSCGARSRRFTILAHGFLLLWECGGIELESRASGLYSLAARFASRVLMPERWVQEIWPKVGNVVAMAGIFEVSVPAMRVRLKELGLLGIVEPGRG